MLKKSRWVSRVSVVVLAFALILAACAGNGGNSNGSNSNAGDNAGAVTPNSQAPTDSAVIPQTGDESATVVATEEATEMAAEAVATESEVTESVTEESTAAPTEASADAGAAPEATDSPEEEGQAVVDEPSLAFLSKLIGSEVQTQDGDAIGTITDLVFDEVTGHVVYAVVGQDDDMNNLLVFPWTALGTNEPLEGQGGQPETFIFNQEQRLLDEAPRVTRDQLEVGEVELWTEELFPYWSEAGDAMLAADVSEATLLRQVSQVENFDVVNGETNESYQVQDMVVDLFSGNILYFIVEGSGLFAGAEANDARMVLIPYDYMTYGTMSDGNSGFVFNIDEDTLQNLPRLEEGMLPTGEPQ